MGVAGAGPPDPGDPAGFFCAEAPGEVLAVANGGVLGEPAVGFFVTGLESHAFIGAGLGAGAFVLFVGERPFHTIDPFAPLLMPLIMLNRAGKNSQFRRRRSARREV